MRLAIAAALLLSTAPSFAIDAVTYKGTLGGHDIVVELADPGNGDPVGRYSYMSQGGDIPLNALEEVDGYIGLLEEAPCTETTCVSDDNGVITNKPIGAVWILQYAADGSLGGNWQAEGKQSKTLDVTLTEIGRRTLPEGTEITPYGLYDSTQQLTYSGGTTFTPEAAPYDFAKMDVLLEEGPVEMLEGSSFRYVTDPRSKFAFPRIVAFADGSSTDAANAALAAEHAQINYFAFDCLSMVYGGFGGRGDMLDMGYGTLGDFDYESVTMAYLSPTLVGWTEGGSTWCGGAHPNNHFDSYIIDAKTGAPFAMGLVFKDWTATTNYDDYDADVDQAAALANPGRYGWQAGQPLIDYVIANRVVSDDESYETECGIDELIASNLGMRFAPDDTVVFSLVGLPHVIFACGDDLVTVKLADIPQFLAPTAKDYFPALN
jgi:hypothetical protein